MSFALRVSSNPFMNRLIIIHTVDQLISITYQVFKLEPFLLAVVVFYGAFFWFGSKINRTKANTWFVSRFFVFTARLSRVGCACWCMRLVPKN